MAGTYWGLCRLLTSCESYDEVLDFAERGDASVVDMLVKDIYGGDCTYCATAAMYMYWEMLLQSLLFGNAKELYLVYWLGIMIDVAAGLQMRATS